MTDFLLKLITEKLDWVYSEMPVKEYLILCIRDSFLFSHQQFIFMRFAIFFCKKLRSRALDKSILSISRPTMIGFTQKK